MAEMTLKLYGWEARERTMLRRIIPGMIFAFAIGDAGYGFGRVLSRVNMGHVVKIFDVVKSEPLIDFDELVSLRSLLGPVVIDSYGLFDRKNEGDWRIIGHEDGFVPSDLDRVFFKYGVPPRYKVVDINDVPIDYDGDASALPDLMTYRNAHVLKMFSDKRIDEGRASGGR